MSSNLSIDAEGVKALRQKAKPRKDRAYGVVPLLAVLLTVGAVSALLDAPNAKAFPQNILAEADFPQDGIGDTELIDINDDTYPDLVLSSQVNLRGDGGQIDVYLGRPTVGGFPSIPSLTLTTPKHQHMIVKDIDLDSRLDIVVLTSQPEEVLIHFQPSNPLNFNDPRSWRNFSLSTPGALSVDAGELALVVGYLDLAVLYQNNLTIYPYLSFFTPYRPDNYFVLNDSAGYDRVYVHDMDDDLSDDVVLTSPLEIKIFYGVNGLMSPQCTLPDCMTYPLSPGLSGVVSLAIDDVSSDGLSDLILGISDSPFPSGAIIILARQGSAQSSRDFIEAFRDVRDLTGDLTLGDFDTDGRTDIAAILHSGGNVALFFQREDGTFENRVDQQLTGTSYTHSGADERIVTLDFNRDGYDDIALRSVGTAGPPMQRGKVSIFLQEDLPVSLDRPIPYQCPNDCLYINQDTIGDNLIDLSSYFSDDHGPIIYNVTSLDAENMTATLDADGHHLDFRPKAQWYGEARFQAYANDLYPNHEPTLSNIFSVMVNAAPSIEGTPPATIIQGDDYNHVISVSDPYPIGDWHTYYLSQAPPGASIDINSGLLKWRPLDNGNFSFTLRVVDSYGAASEEVTFIVEVLVRPEEPPGPGIDIPFPKDVASLAVIGVIVTTLVLISALISFNENVKYGALMLLVPLYSKIKREKVLDHFIRGQIYGYIMANPGEHYNSIKQALDITNGSLAHHLKTLERERFIKSKRFGLYRRFYPWTMRIPEDGYFQLNEIQKNVLDLCENQPGITQKDIAISLNLTPPTINYHISILAEHDYVSVIRRGRKTHVYVINKGSK